MKLINIGASGRTIYKFIREDKELIIEEENDFLPYYYEPEQHDPTHYSFTKEPVKLCYASSDKEVYQGKSNQAYEADIKLCLDKNSWIKMADGSIKQLKQVNIGEEVLGKNKRGGFGRKIITDKWSSVKKSYTINTKSQSIKASEKHKMLILDYTDREMNDKFKWKEVGELTKNDFLIQWMNYEKEPASIRDDWQYLCGFYYGDGSHYKDKRNDLDIVDKDKANLQVLGQILKKYNIKHKYTKSKYQNSWRLKFNERFLYSLKIKAIPYGLPIEYQLSFIAGLFDAEGTFSGTSNASITNTDEELIYWVSSILFGVGLPNKICKYDGGYLNSYKCNDFYTLTICDLVKFDELIKIKSPKKIERLNKHISDKQLARSYNNAKFDVLPLVYLLKRFSYHGGLRGKGWRSNRWYFESDADMTLFFKNLKSNHRLNGLNQNISRKFAKEIYEEIKEKSLKKGYLWRILDRQIAHILAHVFCSKITSINQDKKCDLIDISVEGENFIINNFATHNCKRFLIDKVHSIEKSNIKWAMLDIEIQTKKDAKMVNPFTTDRPISCITIYNNFSKEYKQWYLPDFESEEEMLKIFTWYMANEKFDIIFSWFMNNFDYPILQNKIEKFPDKISPVGKSRYGGRVDEDRLYFPIGTSIVDYMEWDKKYTLNRRVSYALDAVLEDEFGKGKEIKDTDFSIISEEVKQRNLNDVKDMVKLEEKNHLVDYYDNIRRTTFTQWEDLVFNTRLIDTLILKEAKARNVILPSKPIKKIEDDFKSKVLRESFETGSFHNVISVDLSSAYPSTIIDFNLDHDNIVPGITPTSLELAGANFEQKEGGIIPTVAKKLIKIKKEIANKRDSFPVDSPEYKQAVVAYKSIKGIVNSVWGYLADKRTRMYNKDIARAVTRIPKEMLLYCIEQLAVLNINPLYGDTDGLILNTEENIVDMLNSFLKKWAMDKYDKEISTTFDYEGIYTDLLILAKCRYHGYLKHANGEIEEKKIGIEAKRKDSSKFIKKFQTELIEKVHKGITKEDAIKLVEEQKIYIKTLPIEDIAFPSKISKPVAEYESNSVWVRAYKYANEQHNYKVRIGQPYYYIYVESDEYENKYIEQGMIGAIKLTKSKLKPYWIEYFKEEILVKDMSKEKVEELTSYLEKQMVITYKTIKTKGKLKDVIAFDDKHKEHMKNYKVNWHKMIERNIVSKSTVIFEALKWVDDKEPYNKQDKSLMGDIIRGLDTKD